MIWQKDVAPCTDFIEVPILILYLICFVSQSHGITGGDVGDPISSASSGTF